MALRRLSREAKELEDQTSFAAYARIVIPKDDLFHWEIEMWGVPGMCANLALVGVRARFRVTFPPDYPFKPLRVEWDTDHVEALRRCVAEAPHYDVPGAVTARGRELVRLETLRAECFAARTAVLEQEILEYREIVSLMIFRRPAAAPEGPYTINIKTLTGKMVRLADVESIRDMRDKIQDKEGIPQTSSASYSPANRWRTVGASPTTTSRTSPPCSL